MFAEIMQPSTKTSFLIKDLLSDVLINREGKLYFLTLCSGKYTNKQFFKMSNISSH